LVRIIAADENYLSPHYGRESVSISLHHNAGLPYQEYFSDIEPIFRDYGGRPHWAKKHSLSASHLAGLYPEFGRFKSLRQRLDPDGVFMNSHVEAILGES
jgi:FAD/FMN-containing dehydrogenase